MKHQNMNRLYQITGGLSILFSAYIARESFYLKYYTEIGPGPGFFPLWLSVIFALLSAIMLCSATLGKPEPVPANFWPTRVGWVRMGAIFLDIVTTIALLEPMGYRIVTFLFYTFLLSTLGRQNPIVTALVALAGSFGVYHVFVQWLGVPLPVGMFGI